jgi:hypothetical protein
MDAFDDSDVGSSSKIIDLFKKQNRRVLKIFRDSDSENETAGGTNEVSSQIFHNNSKFNRCLYIFRTVHLDYEY